MADQLIQLGCSERSDTVLVNVLLSDRGGVEALLVHNDDLVFGRLAVLKILDDGVDVGSLERIALTVVVPAAGKEVLKSPLVAVEAHYDNVLANAVGDVSLVEGCNCALCHIVVLGVDNVEGSAAVDDGLNDLLCCFCVPVSGLLCNEVPAVVLGYLGVEGAGSADLYRLSSASMVLSNRITLIP